MSTDTHRKQKLVFLGTPEVAAQSLSTLINAAKAPDAEFEVAAVVTQPATMMGRGKKRKLTPSAVAQVAEAAGIEVLAPAKAKDDEFLSALEALAPDLCVTAAYGQWLPKRFLAIPRLGTLNIHPSLLPRWRGASPVQRTLEAGDAKSGVTVLWTVSKMDAGPIASQYECELTGDEKAPDFLTEMFAVGTKELLQLLPKVWSGECSFDSSMPQDEAEVTAADKITVEEGQVCFATESASTVHNKVRAFAGWPGVSSEFVVGEGDPQRIKLITTCVVEEGSADRATEPPPSTDVIVEKGGAMFVECAGGSKLEIKQLQPRAKKATDAKSFVNGLQGKTIKWVPNQNEQMEGEGEDLGAKLSSDAATDATESSSGTNSDSDLKTKLRKLLLSSKWTPK